ncbi:multidrug resistance-associated protein 1-like [Rhynchophorus ferrugineus]|uniref:multidrug resistance-associated protein 1-like n=1 Tax=Rhynchophorus ferrugineus TaxID=354439 RepID=UPI003FCEDE72
MDNFCGSSFWNTSLTWNTTDPDFTTCFEKTALVLLPVGVFWSFLPLELLFLKKSFYKPIAWNWRNVLKQTINWLLVLLCLFEFLSNIPEDIVLLKVNIFIPVLKMISFTASGVLSYKNTKHGYRSSGHQFVFWFLLALCGAPQFRTEIRNFETIKSVDNYFLPTTYMAYFPLVCIMLVLSSISEGTTETLFKGEKESPVKETGFLGKIIYTHIDSILFKGFRKPLELKDIWYLDYENRSKNIVPMFEKEFKRRQDINKKKHHHSDKNGNSPDRPGDVSVFPVLFSCFYPIFIIGVICRFVSDIVAFVNPQILGYLISFIGSDEPMWKGYFYAFVMFASGSFQTIIHNIHFLNLWTFGLRSQACLMSAIYRKALRISNSTKKDKTVGEIVNLMAVDATRFQEFSHQLPLIWSAPLQLGLAIYFLWKEVGPSILAGLAVMLLLIPVNFLIIRKSKALQFRQMRYKDERVKMMNEILNGIKVLKLYAWEPSFEKIIQDIRAKEIKTILQMNYLNAITAFMWNSAPFLFSFVTFATYVLIDENNVLDASKAFVSLSLLNILRGPLNMIPNLINMLVQTMISAKRINSFLNAEEIDLYIEHDTTEADPVIIENGMFSWGDQAILKNINIRIGKSSLAAIVGPVGAGKSSLISALLGEMDKLSGRINQYGTVAYVSQLAWIQNGTVKENIVFGRDFDEFKYKKVISACALEPDLAILANGDLTEIGEKGINLSGGQKQRISLARAVYSDADVYLLDDPLSAVDSHVGKHIFTQVLSSSGLLKDKVRVLVTHGITYLPKTDQVIVMSNGEVSESGSYQNLLEKKGAFADYLIQHINEDVEDETELKEIEEQLEKTPLSAEAKRTISRQRSRLSESSTNMEYGVNGISLSRESLRSRKSTLTKKDHLTSKHFLQESLFKKDKGKLIQTEKSEKGRVKIDVYKYYLYAVGWAFIFWTFMSYAGFQGFGIASNVWLGYWAEDTSMIVDGKVDTGTRNTYLGIYALLGVLQAFCICAANIVFAKGTTGAATKLHGKLMNSVMHLPMNFFDITPCGRILARFSSDIIGIDQRIPNNFNSFFFNVVKFLGAIAIICYTTPIFTSVVIPIGILYVFIQIYFVSTSRQVKRLESVSRSPIYSHFGETISGTTVIRAYQCQDRFVKESGNRIDTHQRCVYISFYANRWLSVRLETIGNFIILASAIFAVISKDINPALVGLSVSYALQITSTLNMLLRNVSEVETNIVSVERLKEYSEAKQERPWDIIEKKPDRSWPPNGHVEFVNYSVRYREGLDLVLKDISFKVRGGEKIGIVGRTGAGKSSLTLSLFRIIEAVGGKIVIDGMNISEIGLHDLRLKLTIIPQDSILFSGSLRMNLDPFDQYSDAEVWRAVELAHLKFHINTLPAGLYHVVSEGGENLSAGQRQLLCLARALLRKTKILILDEATAAVDLETDDLIQKTIRTAFSECTVITIAHRLNTIIDSNRVLVLDNGNIAEFDSPSVLLNEKSSIFYGMCKDAGLVS